MNKAFKYVPSLLGNAIGLAVRYSNGDLKQNAVPLIYFEFKNKIA